MITISIEESDRQILLLAIAKLMIERPGWEHVIRTISAKLQGELMLNEFLRIHMPESEGEFKGAFIEESGRQTILLALATLSLVRPSFDFPIRQIARRLHGEAMLDNFRAMNLKGIVMDRTCDVLEVAKLPSSNPKGGALDFSDYHMFEIFIQLESEFNKRASACILAVSRSIGMLTIIAERSRETDHGLTLLIHDKIEEMKKLVDAAMDTLYATKKGTHERERMTASTAVAVVMKGGKQ